MTMIDEEVLATALRDAANAFALSKDATYQIMTLAETPSASPVSRQWRTPDFFRHAGRGRNILVAAALVLIIGGITTPLLRNSSRPSTSAATFGGLTFHGPAPLRGQSVSSSTNGPSPGFLSVKSSTKQLRAATRSSGPLLKIESTGTIDLTVGRAKVQSAFSTLAGIVTKDGGFVLSTQAQIGTRATGNFSYGTIVLQVPQRIFASLVAQVQRVGHSTSIVTSSSDMTAQYVDLRSRITSLEASRRQYLAIMARAASISDILAVQSQLNSLQSQIEVLQGQMNVLNGATTYATLSVAITEAGSLVAGSHHRSGLATAWHDAVAGFVAGFEWLIRISGPALFALLFAGAVAALWRLAWRAARRRRI